MSGEARPPRRFRRRMLGTMLAAGLLPLAGWGLVSQVALGGFLSFSLAPLEAVLDRAAAQVERCCSAASAEDDEIGQARLFIAQAERARQALVRLVPRAFLVALVLSGAVFTAAAVLMGRALSRPVAQLTEGMMRYARGELSHHIPVRGAPDKDELHFLVQQFNRMGDELEAQRRRLQITEKLQAWQDVARSMAHELKNPLTAMRMALGRLDRAQGRGQGDPSVGESVALLREEVEVLLRMAQSFSEFARLPPAVPEPLELGALLEEVCALYRNQSPVPVECAAAQLPLSADPHQLRRAFGNLVKNAIEASSAASEPVRVEATTEAGRVRVTVSDRGQGINAPKDGSELAGGMASTKPGGSGLGLPISQKIFHEHGGALRLEPRPGGGTVAIVELPLRWEARA